MLRENHYQYIIDIMEKGLIKFQYFYKEKKMKKKIVKKITMYAAVTAMVLSLAACSETKNNEADDAADIVQSQTAAESEVSAENDNDVQNPETITIHSLNGNKEEIELTVPYNPERVAILDMAVLDILDSLNLGDRVAGSASTSLEYLQKYVTDDSIEKLGTIKEADLEAVMACEPDIIFIGGRLSKSYDALSEIAPVVYLSTDSSIGLVESTRKNAETIASIFGAEDEVAAKMADFDSRIEALAKQAEGKTAVVGMTTSGSFNILGNDGRCSIIGVEIGYDNLGNAVVAEASAGEGNGSSNGSGEGKSGSQNGSGEGKGGSQSESQNGTGGSKGGTATHGNEASFEILVKLNPDYIFVMDRDAAIGSDGAKFAKEIVENELVMGTDAYKNGNIIYLAHPAVWYTAEGGIVALDVMLQDLETALR